MKLAVALYSWTSVGDLAFNKNLDTTDLPGIPCTRDEVLLNDGKLYTVVGKVWKPDRVQIKVIDPAETTSFRTGAI